MKIEKEKVRLAEMNLNEVRRVRKLNGETKVLPLNSAQIHILELLQKSMSLQEIIQHYFHNGIWVPFTDMRQLLEFLVEENLILNPTFRSYFDYDQTESANDTSSGAGGFDKLPRQLSSTLAAGFKIENEVEKLPFFRSLDRQLLSFLLDQAKLIDTPASIVICQMGQLQRSLFVLLNGQASVYKRDINTGVRAKLAVLGAGSVFGEVGFFLGQPRTADVITDRKSLILSLKYVPEVFDKLIQSDQARELHTRFLLIRALQKSGVFGDIPEECLDALIISGEVKTIGAEEEICKEGDAGDTCYIIVQGSVVVSQKNKIIRVLGPGDCFGEVALIMSEGKRTASVHSKTDVVTLEIPFHKFYRLLSENFILACVFETVALSRVRADQSRT